MDLLADSKTTACHDSVPSLILFASTATLLLLDYGRLAFRSVVVVAISYMMTSTVEDAAESELDEDYECTKIGHGSWQTWTGSETMEVRRVQDLYRGYYPAFKAFRRAPESLAFKSLGRLHCLTL